MSLNKSLNNLKDELGNLLKMILVSERVNSQRCLNQDLDTTRTIIEHIEKIEENKHDSKLKSKKIELENIKNLIKGIFSEMLVVERINSQRCLNQDLDTSKTILDHKE